MVFTPSCLNWIDLDLKGLLFDSLFFNLAVKHLITFLELCAVIRFLHFSLDSNSNLHGLLPNLVLFDQSCVLAKLLQRHSHWLSHRQHLLLHRVHSIEPFWWYFLLSLKHGLKRILKIVESSVLLLSLGLKLVILVHDYAQLLFESCTLLLIVLTVLAYTLL